MKSKEELEKSEKYLIDFSVFTTKTISLETLDEVSTFIQKAAYNVYPTKSGKMNEDSPEKAEELSKSQETALKKGVDQVKLVIQKDSKALLDIFSAINAAPLGEASPVSYLVDDLVYKMKKADQVFNTTEYLSVFETFFKNNIQKFADWGVSNSYDWKRLEKALPNCASNLEKVILSDEEKLNTIILAEKAPNVTVNDMKDVGFGNEVVEACRTLAHQTNRETPRPN